MEMIDLYFAMIREMLLRENIFLMAIEEQFSVSQFVYNIKLIVLYPGFGYRYFTSCLYDSLIYQDFNFVRRTYIPDIVNRVIQLPHPHLKIKEKKCL